MRIRNAAEFRRLPKAMRDAIRNSNPAAVAKLESSSRKKHAPENVIEAMVTPVHIRIHCVRKRLLDRDNPYYKPVIDGIRDSGLLPDDRPEFVAGISYTQEQGEPEETIVTLEAVDAQATN